LEAASSMQIEPREPAKVEAVVTPHSSKVRVRTEVWVLKNAAVRRRRRANAIVIGSLAVVLLLVGLFYMVLTR
jgi:hypothetical protein